MFLDGISNSYDYSHLLPEEFQKDHKLIVEHTPAEYSDTEPVISRIHKLGEDGRYYQLGMVEGYHLPKNKYLNIDYARLGSDPAEREQYRGKHVGRAMYEAFLAHGANKLKATHVGGSDHSTQASKAHAALSLKHGLDYKPRQNVWGVNPNTEEPGAFDDANQPYKYKIG